MYYAHISIYVSHTHQHPELVLVGYYTNPNVPHDPDGVALMWDLKFHKETPDYIFNCQVRKAIFHYYRFTTSGIGGVG